jgi:phage shock protein C
MKKLYRCRWDRKLGGVCGGLGQYFRVDPTLIRLIVTFVCILSGFIPLILAYIIMWAVLPEGPPTYVEIPCKKLYRSLKDKKISGVCGGLGKYFSLDPTIIRAGFILLTFTTFIIPLALCYLIATFVIPEEPVNL